MKERTNRTSTKPANKRKRLTLIGAIAVTLLVVGIVAAINRNEVPSFVATNGAATAPAQRSTEVSQTKGRYYVTLNAQGQQTVIDRKTGDQRPLSPDEARTLAEGIKQLVNNTTDGLVQVHHANGMVSMDLQGHFQNVLLAKKDADGTVSQSCVNDLESAAEFFDIDPALLGISAPRSQSGPTSANLPIR